MSDFRIETERLTLREWRDDDAAAMHAIGCDARVMEFLGPPMNKADAHRLVAGQIVNQSLFGHCFWPVERSGDGVLLGYCGVNVGLVDSPWAGEIEIGWLLAYDAWGQGYAREAAQATLDWCWSTLAVPGVLTFTVAANERSCRLMERLGMTRRPDRDFDHPDLPLGDPLRPHIVYRIDRPAA